ncbi:hypothetical protein ScPMuIL_015581 [Solemya velum]
MELSLQKIDVRELEDLRHLLWGKDLKDEVFLRWTQGFSFSPDEPTALCQLEGGPCAVIAPVQAFVLKNALFNKKLEPSSVTGKEAKELLVLSLTEILLQLGTDTHRLLFLEADGPDSQGNSPTCSTNGRDTESGERSPKRQKLDPGRFHSKLRCIECDGEESLMSCIRKNLSEFQTDFGVLLYLYSLILTKGIEQTKNELEDLAEPLIDETHGHGSQSLINLMLVGKAISNVWDNDKEVSGLVMRGIQKQSTIGFLTLMEHLRYCEVGWFLKNPKFPIWLLASETHITVLFSKELGLVVKETKESNARQIFQRFDPEGNGFITTCQLGDLMEAVDLVSEKEYVDIMKTKLDPENLGIVTLNSFLEEFYPGESTPEVPTQFILYHYNGLCRSSHDGKVKYKEAKATIKEELDIQIITDTSPMKTCLETKWPSIELGWLSPHIPSLN